MKRREFLKTAGIAAAWTLSRGALGESRQAPNLLIIHTDEHNVRTLGCYRATLPEEQAFIWGRDAVLDTPNIDWLATHGALCTRYYATTPVCSPSRSALMSGLYPQNTPVTTNNVPMRDEVVTFAEILRRNGYATGYAGKWHLDGSGKPEWAPQRKFGFTDNRYMFNRGHWKQLEDTPEGPGVKARDAQGQPTYSVEGADEKSFTTDFLADKTADFIDAHKDEPFCFMVSLPDPHGPNAVRPPYDTMFDGMNFEAPRTFAAPEESVPKWGPKQLKKWPGASMSKYFGMVKCIDDNVGKILEALRRNRLIDNTIIVFTSDHGDMCGEHARENKGVPYETSARVALVLCCPQKVKAGTVVRQALSCVDFPPTILRLMGFDATGAEEGRDASALFTTGKAPAEWKDIAFMRSTCRPGSPPVWLAAVTSRYKLVFSQNDKPWLFDLEKDPDELVNFFQHPECRETLRSLSKELIAYCETHNDPAGGEPKYKADLAWAAEGTGEYTLPPGVQKAEEASGGGKGAKKGGKKRAKTNEDEE